MPPTPPPIFDPSIAIALTSIRKTFGNNAALSGASLTARRNTIHALLGENGAGKTTLMRIAFGMIPADSGSIIINQQVRQFHSSADAIAAGVGMVHQHFMLVPAMTVAENIALGGQGRYVAAKAEQRVRTLSQQTGLEIDPRADVGSLPVGAQQRVEILKAFSKNATILILDEPTAVLAPEASRDLLTRMRTFAETQGTVILITHKLRDALEFADDVTVLRRGETVLTSRAKDVDERTLAEAMIGSSRGASRADGLIDGTDGGTKSGSGATQADVGAGITSESKFEASPRAPAPASVTPESFADHPPTLQPSPAAATRTASGEANHRGRPRDVFRLRNVDAVDARGVKTVNNVSLTVHGGEIVGIAAVEGSGQYELLRLLSGRISPSTGFVELPPTVGFIPEDRHRDALVLDFPLYENVALFGAGSRRGRVRWNTVREATGELMDRYDVRAPSSATRAVALSGGNQQKLIAAREIDGAPLGLVAENPTRGLDIMATRAVHDRLRAARADGTAIVLYSSDLDEVIELADRILVMYAGTVQDVGRDRERIGHVMLTGFETSASIE